MIINVYNHVIDITLRGVSIGEMQDEKEVGAGTASGAWAREFVELRGAF